MENYNIYEEPKGNILSGVIGALIGAILGAVIWALVGMLGYIAAVAGLLIAFLASKGYDLMKGRPGVPKLIILIICVILAVILGNVLCTGIQMHQLYVEEGYSAWMDEVSFFKLMTPILLEDSEFTGSFTQDTLMGFFFAALGCFGILRDTVSKKKKQPEAIETPANDNTFDNTNA